MKYAVDMAELLCAAKAHPTVACYSLYINVRWQLTIVNVVKCPRKSFHGTYFIRKSFCNACSFSKNVFNTIAKSSVEDACEAL